MKSTKKKISKPGQLRKGLEIVRRLEVNGLCFELVDSGNDFEIVSYALDDAGEYIPIAPAILREIEESRKLILEGLRHRESSFERIKAILIQHNPEWKAEFGQR